MDIHLRAAQSSKFPPRISRDENSKTITPVLPYRSTTIPESLTMRLKHPQVLCTNSWLKRSPSDHSDHATSRLRCSRRLESEQRRGRPASMAPELKHVDRSLPPPLPPKRSSSRSPVLPFVELKQPDFSVDLEEEKDKEKHFPDETDVCSALKKITNRLDQMQVECSPILGHYSLLYRLDTPIHTPPPRSPSYLPRLKSLSQRPQRCAYTNLKG